MPVATLDGTLVGDDEGPTAGRTHSTLPVVVPMRKPQGRHRAGPDLRELVPTEPGGVKPVNVDIHAGATIGGYTLTARIGAGGMGTVWLARQLSLDRNVAVKILRPALANNPEFVVQFAHEALAAAQLVHHNIAQIYDTGTEGKLHFFSMEYVEGESLSAMIRREGKLDCEVAAGYVLQAARGLEFAHDRQMIHRDIKPENLLVNRDGIVKVADLGLVMRTDAEEAALKKPLARLQTIQDLPLGFDEPELPEAVGTPAFMAPEQANDSATVDLRADVYSLGCTLYTLVTGRPPFDADSAVVLMSKHFFEAPVPPEQHNRRVPAQLSAIILKMIAKKPEARYQNMDAVITALEEFLGVDGSAAFSPREEHASLLEQAVARFNGAAWALRRKLIALGGFLGVAAGIVAAAVLHAPRVAFGMAGFAAAGWFAWLVIHGIAQRTTVVLKLRQLALTAPLWAWLVTVLTTGVGLGVLAWFALLKNVLLIAGLGALAAIAFFVLVDRRLARERRPALDAVEQMLKGMRLRGLEELALRQFVCKYAGQDWEPIYEALFGYEAKLLARQKWGRDEKNLPRKRRGAWRDPVVGWLDRRIEDRQRMKDERHLASLAQRLSRKSA